MIMRTRIAAAVLHITPLICAVRPLDADRRRYRGPHSTPTPSCLTSLASCVSPGRHREFTEDDICVSWLLCLSVSSWPVPSRLAPIPPWWLVVALSSVHRITPS